MGWTVSGLNPSGGEIFHTCPVQPWGPPSLFYNGYWVFPGVKAAGGVVLTTCPPSNAQVKERVEPYLCSSGPSLACYRVNFTCAFTVCCRREGETFPVLDVAGFCVQHMGEGTA